MKSRAERFTPAFLAAVTYIPLLLTHPHMVGADTKQYLYLDPSRLLGRAASMWDPSIGMGTVTHQNIGYLLPMGPWYWGWRALHVPTWVAQRLWTATLLWLAGLGVVFLLRTLGWRRADSTQRSPGDGIRGAEHAAAVLVAALAYMLSPYVLEYEARISAILMPWAGLPWMLALVVRGIRSGSWRHPALFAIVVALIGGVNATSLIYAGVAPVLWFPFAVWVTQEATLRSAAVTFVRTGSLTVLASLWWMAGLLTQAGYGLDVLRYTETVQTVAQTGLPIEILRGLGNWYFYGRDNVGPWVQPASEYTQQLWHLAISYFIPIMAFAAAVAVRWRYRLYFVTLVVVGLAIAVGVHPYSHPAPLGALFKSFANSSSAGLALRSVGRAEPLVALGAAVLLGSGIDAVHARWSGQSRLALMASLVVGGLVLANMTPLFTGQFVDDNLQRPNDIPSYWRQAAAYLDGRGPATRVLELPGADFSHYRWGATLDPVTPGLMNRPFVSRELIPYGSAASADLVRAVDRRLQEGVFEPDALAPLARLMGVGDVVLRSDLQYERYQTPRPRPTWQQFDPTPSGLADPVTFGPPVPSRPVIPDLDEITLATPPSVPAPPAVAVYGVRDAIPIVRTEASTRPVIVSGDGEGLVDLAAAGLLDGRSADDAPILYSGYLDGNPAAMAYELARGADLVITDTNRKRGQRWGTIRDNNGYTETATERPLTFDPTDARLPLFPGAGQDAFTVSEQRGVAAIRATAFGNPVSYAPGERPDLALDGDLTTAWKAGAFSDVMGDRLRIDLSSPVTTDHIGLVQPLVGARERYITEATVSFDGGSPIHVRLTPDSRTPAGQVLHFSPRTFSRLDITVDAMNFGRRADYRGGSPVGFAEVRIPGVRVDELVRLPTDLLDAAGASSIDHRLVLSLTRMRSNPLASFETDEEQAMARTFSLPTARTFSLTGTARLSAANASDPVPAPDASGPPPYPSLVNTPKMDDALDRDLGLPSLADGALVVRSSERLPGDLHARAEAAVDSDPATAWTTAFGDPEGKWIEVRSPHPVTFDHLNLEVVADGRHSVPTRVQISVDGQAQTVAIPPVVDGRSENATAVVTLPLHRVTGSTIRLTILAARHETTINYLSATAQALPVAIAELGIPGMSQPLQPGQLPGGCRNDLLSVDGAPVGIRITGSRAAALDRQPLHVELCSPSGLTLGPGHHDLRATPGGISGIDIDRLIMASGKGGAALNVGTGLTLGRSFAGPTAPAAGANASPDGRTPSPAVRITNHTPTSLTLSLDVGSVEPFWLVLGQSHNTGWSARVIGPGSHSLGPPALVDGYANGWLITPRATGAMRVALVWAPQRRVDVALVLSALALLGCIGLAILARDRQQGHAGTNLPAGSSALPVRPLLASPLRWSGRPLRRRTSVAVVVLGAVASAVVVAPVAGLIVGAILAAVVGRPRRRILLSGGATALLALSAAYVVQLQFRYRFPTKIEWPEHFDRVALVPWVATALLMADAVVEHLRFRRTRGERPADP